MRRLYCAAHQGFGGLWLVSCYVVRGVRWLGAVRGLAGNFGVADKSVHRLCGACRPGMCRLMAIVAQ
jgi:hypothetical protein